MHHVDIINYSLGYFLGKYGEKYAKEENRE